MSVVTNLLLHFHMLEDEPARIRDVNRYFSERGLVSLDDERLPRAWYGGTKALEARLYVGAFNYLHLDAFLAHLRAIHWAEPGAVQVFAKEEDDDVFRVRHLTD